MRVQIKSAFQVQRINQLINQLEEFEKLNVKELTKRPHSKSWSPVEVMGHMIIAHNVYKEKIEHHLGLAEDSEVGNDSVQASALPSRLMKMFPPKDGKVRFKMKTFKKFKPVYSLETISESNVQKVISDLKTTLFELKSWVEAYRLKKVNALRFASAIGPIVRFNVPEACEFVLCHNERHFQQILDALDEV